MIYRDCLYGSWELPDFLEKLVHTKEMVRLRNIAQSVMPNCLMPYGTIPSRFHHGLGVAYLAMEVLRNNPILSDYRVLLPVASLLHDAGNPPFSHLGEYFLKEVTGKDGESFLEDVLDGSETEGVLKNLGVDVNDILGLVTGKTRPLAEILNGSMDIDNLDNVGRFNNAAGFGRESFDALRLASAFRLLDSGWMVSGGFYSYEEAQKWKRVRFAVYNSIYGAPHLNVAVMLYRAVELAFAANNLSRDFFFLDDFQALEHLLRRSDDRTVRLVERALRWDWYEEMASLWTTEPSQKMISLAPNWRSRMDLANKICERFDIPVEDVCVYMGKGRDKRRITLPFVSRDGEWRYDDSADEAPIYRVKVYASEKYSTKKELIHDFVEQEIS